MDFIKEYSNSYASEFGSSEKGNWTIGKRITFLTLSAAAITLILGTISIIALNKIDNYSDRLVNVYISEWSTGTALEQTIRKSGHEYLQYKLTDDDQYFDLVISHFDKINGEISDLKESAKIAELQELSIQVNGLEEASESYQENLQAYYDAGQALVTNTDMSRLNDISDALMQAEKSVDEAYNELLQRSVEISAAAEGGAREQAALTVETVSNYVWAISIIAILAVVLALFLGLFVGRRINNILRNIIYRLNSGSEQVNVSSDQLSGSSQELAESSSQQAASLQETTSSLEEMSNQIKQSADNSGQAEVTMNESRPLLDKGVHEMNRMIEAM